MKYLLAVICILSIHSVANGQRWNKAPFIGSDGVIEVGKYIDFHESHMDTNDYSVRLTSISNKLFSNRPFVIGSSNGMLSDNGLTLGNGNSSLELIHSYSSSGYGSKIYGVDESGGKTSLRIAVRGNSSTWIDAIYVKAATSSIGGTGNVGIGTNNPIGKFHLKDTRVDVYTSSGTSNGWSKDGLTVDADSDTNFSTLRVHSDHAAVTDRGLLNITRQSNNLLYVRADGNVGIGTKAPDAKLAVNGTIHSKEVKVDLNGWSDFVFENNYELRTLDEVETFITENKHLPEIPSEAEVTENGINLGEMNTKLLQKIEELTLYMIEMNKRIDQLEKEKTELKDKSKN